MKREYIEPEAKVFMFIQEEPVALLRRGINESHDNGYIDWFADEDAERRGTKE